MLAALVERPEVFEYKVLTESKDPVSKKWSVTIDVPLQRLGKVNGNARIYSVGLMRPIIEGVVQQLIQKKHLVGEAGHPISEYIAARDNDSALKRIVDINPKFISHTFDKMWLDGDLIRGHVRTLASTQYGQEMTGLILVDKLNLGFSARSVGDSESRGGYEYILPAGFKFLTYDSVFNPSNGDDAIMTGPQNILTESMDIVKPNKIVIPERQICIDNRCALMEAVNSSNMSNVMKNEFYKDSIRTALGNLKF